MSRCRDRLKVLNLLVPRLLNRLLLKIIRLLLMNRFYACITLVIILLRFVCLISLMCTLEVLLVGCLNSCSRLSLLLRLMRLVSTRC